VDVLLYNALGAMSKEQIRALVITGSPAKKDKKKATLARSEHFLGASKLITNANLIIIIIIIIIRRRIRKRIRIRIRIRMH
jgi:hypothetical protein